jgi:hypothetical protein
LFSHAESTPRVKTKEFSRATREACRSAQIDRPRELRRLFRDPQANRSPLRQCEASLAPRSKRLAGTRAVGSSNPDMHGSSSRPHDGLRHLNGRTNTHGSLTPERPRTSVFIGLREQTCGGLGGSAFGHGATLCETRCRRTATTGAIWLSVHDDLRCCNPRNLRAIRTDAPRRDVRHGRHECQARNCDALLGHFREIT